MLKQWLVNDGKTDSITVEEKYVRWTEELRTDNYKTDSVSAWGVCLCWFSDIIY